MKNEKQRESYLRWYAANREKERERVRRNRLANIDHCRKQNREYLRRKKQENPEWARKAAEKTRQWHQENPDKVYLTGLFRRMGITSEDYAFLVERSGGRCEICGEVEKVKTRLSVDHDHSTGDLRGLLCTRCNHALTEYVLSVPEWLQKAAGYLKLPPRKRSKVENPVS